MAKLILNGETPKVYVSVPVDPNYVPMHGSNFETKKEGSSMTPTANDISGNEMSVAWNGGTLLGLTIVYRVPLNKTVYKGIKIKCTTGASAYNTASDVYKACCGIRSGYSLNYIGNTSTGWKTKQVMDQLNHEYEFEFDLDELEGNDLYFYVCFGGWNATINEWGLVRR